ncbi:MAG TPA: hypothetical protein PKV82_11715, partial [Anaerolineae bacterium]|nr:hypothetical protein [Anaerolineae bacterium]
PLPARACHTAALTYDGRHASSLCMSLRRRLGVFGVMVELLDFSEFFAKVEAQSIDIQNVLVYNGNASETFWTPCPFPV